MNKPAVISITDAITSDRICKELGVTHHSVRYARTTGLFPASWYAPLLDLCGDAGVECPMSAFNWKAFDDAPSSEAV